MAISPNGLVSLNDGLHKINHSLRFLPEGGSMVFPVREISSGNRLIYEGAMSPLHLAILIVVDGPLGFSYWHL